MSLTTGNFKTRRFFQEFFWSYPDLEPLYQAARSYLEIGQRIDLLNARVAVRAPVFLSLQREPVFPC
jgi:uncharacterized Rmd1/YagE family protein